MRNSNPPNSLSLEDVDDVLNTRRIRVAQQPRRHVERWQVIVVVVVMAAAAAATTSASRQLMLTCTTRRRLGRKLPDGDGLVHDLGDRAETKAECALVVVVVVVTLWSW